MKVTTEEVRIGGCMRHRWCRALTEDEMHELHDVAASIEETIVKLFSYGLTDCQMGSWDEQATIVPTDFAIPEAQWQQICSWVQKASSDGVDTALTFMNIGPSSCNG